MQTTELTPELKQMNRYWMMLVATLNELDMALNQGDCTTEERLAKVRTLHDLMQSRMPRQAPPSVMAEGQAREAERARDEAAEPEQYYRRMADGTFAGPFSSTAEDGAPFTPEEDAVMQADWERAHARRNNMA